jgi:hypothetical protein
VDLQVLGVWGRWRVKDGSIDLSESQIEEWASIVNGGWALAGRRVPVVLFHDWGFGGFPWMKVSPADRKLWTRVRGAEIYAAGGFFAFPVHGPFGNDALRDGTLREVARQTAFYQRHKALYLGARLLGFEPLKAEEPLLSLSPDWPGEKKGEARSDGRSLTVVLPELQAYAVAILDYDGLPELTLAGRRIVPARRWARPDRNEFVVEKGGTVREQWALNGLLQGRLHTHLRNPPTFVVNLPRGGALRVHVRAVATLGARLECLVDGRLVKAVDLPDRDGKNDSSAREYDATYEFPIPPGKHRVTARNVGGDWLTVAWYAFTGEVGDP